MSRFENNVDASFLLAEIYLYSNFSTPPNPQKTLHYYNRVVELSQNATAHYMLGFLYSSGLFGKIDMDQGKALLHYQQASDLGEIRATMCLAYRYYTGMSVQQDYDLAIYYYSIVAKESYKYILDSPVGGPNIDSYNIRISDFEGGLYGEDVRESGYSLNRMPEDEAKVFGELSLDSESLVFAKYYFDAKLQYRGNYFRERNYTSTREILEQSIAVGVLDYNFDSIEEHRVNSLDSLFFGKCCGLLGHLYLRGEGTNQDYNRAYDLLFLASKYTNSTQVAVDLGLIHEYGLSDDLIPDPQTAKAFYSGHKFPLIGSDTDLAKAAYHSGRVTLKLKDERYGYNIIEAAAYKSNSEALYHLAQCFERGIKPSKSEDIATIYKIFVEKIEPVVSPLKWAFDSAMDGDNEMALLGYAMAAELGYESAQSSAAYLLYPKILLYF
ncbi:unnamed protein product [[Candida] boidinii]|nr:unnamed protein product [[Candida] boidinii]